MRIGELAQRTQTPVDTIRYYERLGLLPRPARTTTNYRSYSAAQAERLQFIRRCRSLDMSLDEIRSLLVFCDQPERHCDDVNGTIEAHIRHVDERIEELKRLARELRQLRAACRAPGASAHCQILATLRTEAPKVSPSAREHVGRSHGDAKGRKLPAEGTRAPSARRIRP